MGDSEGQGAARWFSLRGTAPETERCAMCDRLTESWYITLWKETLCIDCYAAMQAAKQAERDALRRGRHNGNPEVH